VASVPSGDPRGEVWAVILAAGTSRRFGGSKQFETLRGVPLVERVIGTATEVCDAVVVVLPATSSDLDVPVTATVRGGVTRADSVRFGLAAVPDDAEIVVIHDSAHPLASTGLFRAVIEAVEGGAAAAVPVLPLAEALKHVEDDTVVKSPSMEGLHIAQTPQAFRARVLRAAHAGAPQAIEDSVLVEELGETVVTVPGDPANVHVVTRRDLDVAERLVDLVD